MTTDDERVAYLTGEATVSLDPADREDLDGLRGLLAEPAMWAQPDPGLQDRIIAEITIAAGRQTEPRTPPTRAVHPITERAPDVATPVALASRNRRRPRVRLAVMGSAAAAVTAAGVGLAIIQGPQPQQFTAALAGTALAPGASGQVSLTRTGGGWRIDLQANGLPRLDNGSYYQGWLKDPNGMLVPVGTFNEPTDITLWAGVSPVGFPTLIITRQHADGNPTSTGQIILTGATHPTH